MFALPGTAPHAKVKNGRTTIKKRYYLNESMRLLALEEKKPDWNMLPCWTSWRKHALDAIEQQTTSAKLWKTPKFPSHLMPKF